MVIACVSILLNGTNEFIYIQQLKSLQG